MFRSLLFLQHVAKNADLVVTQFNNIFQLFHLFAIVGRYVMRYVNGLARFRRRGHSDLFLQFKM